MKNILLYESFISHLQYLVLNVMKLQTFVLKSLGKQEKNKKKKI
jgi:hypothetical protein